MLVRPGHLLARGGRRAALDLRLAGASALDGRITFTRASTATDLLSTATSGTYNSFTSGAPRLLSGLGLLVEEARTQSLGVTDTPATQTITLGVGTFTHWMIGSGSLTSAAGTAVGSGFGASTQGSPKTITITTGGTVVFTVSGTVTRIQNENGAFPTSYIPNPGAVGTTVTRSADVATMTLASIGIPANPAGLTIIGKARTGSVVSPTQNFYTAALSDGSASNRLAVLRASSGNINAFDTSGGVAQVSLNPYVSIPASQDFAFWFALQNSDAAAQVIGQTKVTSASGIMPTGLNILHIGGDAVGGQQSDSTIARLQIYNRRLPDAQAAAIAASL